VRRPSDHALVPPAQRSSVTAHRSAHVPAGARAQKGRLEMTWRLECPKCRGEMEQGFVVDRTYGAQLVSQWAKGAPVKSFWTGTKLPDEELPIGTYRCSSCGYLEAYARDDFAAE
jgi:hypothetical protein